MNAEPVIDPAPVEAPPVVDPTPEPVEAAAERDVESDTLEIPDSSMEGGKAKYVPLSALSGARSELRELKGQLEQAKAGSARAEQLEQQIAALTAQVQQMAPFVQAYQAAVQQPAPSGPAELSADEHAELTELARTLDLYDAQGQPDVQRAQKVAALVDTRAGRQAQASVAPIHQHTVSQQAAYMLARAKATAAPNGQKPDPTVLEAIWARLDPAIVATPDGARQAWIQAFGLSAMGSPTTAAPARNANGQFTPQQPAAAIPDPLHTERAGGRDTPATMPLSDMERRMAKDMGLTEQEYMARANNAPWLRK